MITRILISGSKDGSFDDETKYILRHFLSEFVIHHKKYDGSECEPSTIHSYVQGVLRALSSIGFIFDLDKDGMMNRDDEGLLKVMDNHFSDQQARGMGIKPHNTLSTKDIVKIFESAHCSPTTSTGYRNRLVSTLDLSPGGRISALWLLTVSQFTKHNIRGVPSWMYTGKLANDVGSAKCSTGGVAAIKRVPLVIPIYNTSLLKG